jgi:hypothetical protein
VTPFWTCGRTTLSQFIITPKPFKVIIDQNYWRIKDPEFPEDDLIWYTDDSRADSKGKDLVFVA